MNGVKRGRDDSTSTVAKKSTANDYMEGVIRSGEHPKFEEWRRPPVEEGGVIPDPSSSTFTFQQIEVDHVQAAPNYRYAHQANPNHTTHTNQTNSCKTASRINGQAATVPVMRVFGTTEAGNSVLVNVHDFYPYLYVQAPEGLTATLLDEEAIRRYMGMAHDSLEVLSLLGNDLCAFI